MSRSNRTKAEKEVIELTELVSELTEENNELKEQIEYLIGIKNKYGGLFSLLDDIAVMYEETSPKKLRKIDEFILDRVNLRMRYTIEK